MNGEICLPSVIIANLMGVIILISTWATQSWRNKTNLVGNKTVKTLSVAAVFACIFDTICFIADGKPGIISHFLVYGSNWYLFAAGLIVGPCWLLFVANYIKYKLHPVHKYFLIAINTIGALLLIFNFFSPVVFEVGLDNVYDRGPLFFYFAAIQTFAMVDSAVIYYIAKRKSGMLKFFPVWAFLIPVACGMFIQTAFYGICTIWPFIALAISCVLSSLQNELLFRDKLTGLYNRFYLSYIENKDDKNNPRKLTLMMIDINDFKSINDNYGHKVGDEALIEMANILVRIVGPMGEVVRYAGDEFILLINSQDDDVIDGILYAIDTKLKKFSSDDSHPYELSASVGTLKVNLERYNLDDILDETDRKMYKEKRKFHGYTED